MVVDHKEQGRRNRAAGKRFEVEVREDLEKDGWVVTKWANQIEFNEDTGEGRIIGAKPKWNPFKRTIMYSNVGFPDYLAFNKNSKETKIILIECKKNGYLDKDEKKKCAWLVRKKIVDKVIVAKKGKEKIEYREIKNG